MTMPQIDAILLASIVALLTFISAIVQAERKEAKIYRKDNEDKITRLFEIVGSIHEGLNTFEARSDTEGIYHSKLHKSIDESFVTINSTLKEHENGINSNRQAIAELKHGKK